MKYILTHYSGDWEWVKEYTDDFLIYNRTDEEIPNSIKRENVGDADYDRLSYIVDNYYNLPEVFLLSKSNLFKYVSKKEFDEVKDNTVFTPLLTQHHKVYEPICRYRDGLYEEVNNSWYLQSVPAFHFSNYGEFARAFNLPNPDYLQFAPGGNYILTRETVHKYGKEFYEELRSILPYCAHPGEAHMIERSLYTLWR
jgi:hypothetical protein